jgi:carboxymethylenebutenolidase
MGRWTLAALLTSLGLTLQAAAQDNATSGRKPAKIPADAGFVVEALKTSSRHGEFVDIDLPGGSKLKAWVVYPERPTKAGVVIVIHEIFGLTDWIRGVADQLAADGFIAIAPDLLSGKGPGGGGTESFEGDKVREAIRGLSSEQVNAQLDAARAYGVSLPAANGRSATVGFCWGGSASFAYAAHQPALNAAVVFYGTGPKEPERYATIGAPVLGLYGADDARVNATIEASEQAMARAGKSFVKHVYDGAGHGFLRQQDGRDGKNLAAARAAWVETIALLQRELEK